MAQPGPEPPDPRELAHRLRGPLNNMLLWSAVLAQQLRNAPPLTQRALEGLQQAVRDQVRIIEQMLERSRSGDGPREAGRRSRPRSP